MADPACAAADPAALTRRLLRENSVNPPGDTSGVAAVLRGVLEAAGYGVLSVPTPAGGENLLAVLPGHGRKAPLCLTGHMDTVPLGEAPWGVDPFGGEERDGRLFGRGASDMKSGLAALAVAATQAAGLAFRASDVVLALTAGEETGCLGATALVRSGRLPPRAGALVVAEPTDCRPLVGHKGALWLRAVFSGKAAHGSMPEMGRNAVEAAILAGARLPGLFAGSAAHPLLGPPTSSIGTLRGGGKVNVVPDRAVMEVDVRTVPGMDHALVRRELARLWPQAALEILADVPPVLTRPDDPFVTLALDILEAESGTRPTPGAVSYFTDASVLAGALGDPPVLIFGPGEPGQAHQTDESCPVAAIARAAGFFSALFRAWLSTES